MPSPSSSSEAAACLRSDGIALKRMGTEITERSGSATQPADLDFDESCGVEPSFPSARHASGASLPGMIKISSEGFIEEKDALSLPSEAVAGQEYGGARAAIVSRRVRKRKTCLAGP